MFSDPQFWVLIAFLIFVGAIFVPARKFIITNLDNKINIIKKHIENAEKLKNEAQETLSQIKKRNNEVDEEINVINLQNEEKIKNMFSNANAKLKEKIKKRNNLASLKIDQMIREANNDMQYYLSKNAIAATINLLEKKLGSSEKQKLINLSIKEINSVLKS